MVNFNLLLTCYVVNFNLFIKNYVVNLIYLLRILRHEEISGLAEKRLSSGYKRKDLVEQFEGSPSNK